jgi:hypothetical protein
MRSRGGAVTGRAAAARTAVGARSEHKKDRSPLLLVRRLCLRSGFLLCGVSEAIWTF